MITKASIRNRTISFLIKILNKLLGKYNTTEYNSRVAAVKQTIHELLLSLTGFKGNVLIENGIFNYFELPNGSLPHFDFVLPEHYIYIKVFDVRSASWEEARLRGIARGDWEQYQDMVSTYQLQTELLPTKGKAVQPKFVGITWADSVEPNTLLKRIVKD